MNINSVQELNNFNLLILSYNDIDIKLIENNFSSRSKNHIRIIEMVKDRIKQKG